MKYLTILLFCLLGFTAFSQEVKTPKDTTVFIYDGEIIQTYNGIYYPSMHSLIIIRGNEYVALGLKGNKITEEITDKGIYKKIYLRFVKRKKEK